MNAKLLSFTLIGFLFCHTSISQIPSTIDSLDLFLHTKPKNSLYLKAMKDFALLQINKGHYQQADSLSNSIKIISEKLNLKPQGLYFSYIIEGNIANVKSEFKVALTNYFKSKQIAEKDLTKDLVENSVKMIADVYRQTGDEDSLMKYSLQAIAIMQKYPFKPLDPTPYQFIGNILTNSWEFERALGYYQRAVAICTANKNDKAMCSIENRLGNLYARWKKPQEALVHYEKGLVLAKKIDSTPLQNILLINLGNINSDFKKYSKAEKYYKQSEEICRNLALNIDLSTVCLNLGELYQNQKKYSLSEKYFKEALALATKLVNPELEKKTNQRLATLYADMGIYKKAYVFSNSALWIKDSLYKFEGIKNSQELLTKYETEKKETQIKLLSEQAKADNFQKNAYLGGGILTVLLAGLLIFSLQNRNKLKQLQDSQRLRNKISSDLHDEIGSTLSSISLLSGMTEEKLRKNDSSKAEQMVHRIHQDSQQVMESIDDIIWTVNPQNDSLPQMILRLKAYATPLAESKNIQLDFQSPLDINSIALSMEIRRNIYLITKEAINNLVKYSNATLASIRFQKEGKMLDIQIVDNGIGFDVTRFSDRNGLRNMQERAKEMKAQINIQSAKNEGTQIYLKVPIV